jgi:hypothetical protein
MFAHPRCGEKIGPANVMRPARREVQERSDLWTIADPIAATLRHRRASQLLFHEWECR